MKNINFKSIYIFLPFCLYIIYIYKCILNKKDLRKSRDPKKKEKKRRKLIHKFKTKKRTPG
jgi:hypothetical protein